jgi:hypothetical protein
MKLEDLPRGTRVFVDANILIYHYPHPVGGHASTDGARSVAKGLITGGQPAHKLKAQPEVIKGFVRIISRSGRFLVCVSASKRLPQLGT